MECHSGFVDGFVNVFFVCWGLVGFHSGVLVGSTLVVEVRSNLVLPFLQRWSITGSSRKRETSASSADCLKSWDVSHTGRANGSQGLKLSTSPTLREHFLEFSPLQSSKKQIDLSKNIKPAKKKTLPESTSRKGSGPKVAENRTPVICRVGLPLPKEIEKLS